MCSFYDDFHCVDFHLLSSCNIFILFCVFHTSALHHLFSIFILYHFIRGFHLRNFISSFRNNSDLTNNPPVFFNFQSRPKISLELKGNELIFTKIHLEMMRILILTFLPTSPSPTDKHLRAPQLVQADIENSRHRKLKTVLHFTHCPPSYNSSDFF